MIRISSNVDEVIKRIEAYRNAIPNRLERLLERLATIGATEARVRFSQAMYAGDNDVTITVEPVSKTCWQIIAEGQAVLFIEFGTGISNPEHPQSSEFGFSHGTYGKGKGMNPNGWVYVGEQGNAGQTLREGVRRTKGNPPVREGVYRTKGNPPARAMYESSKEIQGEILRIATEVFG